MKRLVGVLMSLSTCLLLHAMQEEEIVLQKELTEIFDDQQSVSVSRELSDEQNENSQALLQHCKEHQSENTTLKQRMQEVHKKRVTFEYAQKKEKEPCCCFVQ